MRLGLLRNNVSAYPIYFQEKTHEHRQQQATHPHVDRPKDGTKATSVTWTHSTHPTSCNTIRKARSR